MRAAKLFRMSGLVALLLAAPELAPGDEMGPRAFNPGVGDFSKSDPNHVRLVAWNTEKQLMSTTPTQDLAYQRVLKALNPDIICLEEMDPDFSIAQIQARLNSIIPIAGGGAWQLQLGTSDGFNRNVLASKWPQSMKIRDTTPPSGLRGVTCALINLPDATYGSLDLYLMGEPLQVL